MPVDGTWNLTIATPLGKQQVTYRFFTEHGRLSGDATQGSETVALLDLMLNGGRLTWTQQVTRPMKLKLSFDVTLDGDQLSGTAKAGALPASKVYGERTNPGSRA